MNNELGKPSPNQGLAQGGGPVVPKGKRNARLQKQQGHKKGK